MDMEERLRVAELGPDPAFFETVLDDEALLDGKRAKAMVVTAHQPGKNPKFTKVEMSGFNIVDHGTSAVVTCTGLYEAGGKSFTLQFMRVWMKKETGWKIIAGSIIQPEKSK